jgi:hypothetical protein
MECYIQERMVIDLWNSILIENKIKNHTLGYNACHWGRDMILVTASWRERRRTPIASDTCLSTT